MGQTNAHCDAGNSEAVGHVAASQASAPIIAKLMRIHYGFFMVNPRFWYDKNLQEADAIIVIAASNLRTA
jgi:hypothetical protein